MSITPSDQDKNTLRTAAYGVISLLTAADTTGSPHKIATEGSIALSSATGLVGHVLAENPQGADLDSKSLSASPAPAIGPGMAPGLRDLGRLTPR